jgi:hypothetical protein
MRASQEVRGPWVTSGHFLSSLRNERRDHPQHLEYKASKETLSPVFHHHTPLSIFVEIFKSQVPQYG